jgi:hypothetical protein
MHELKGRRLLIAVSILTSLGFLLIGFDNGLMGGLGVYNIASPTLRTTELTMA